MKKEIELTDAVVLPVMEKHNIPREEAEARLQLLFKSSILDAGDPGNPETQQMIDNFLAQDSGAMAQTVLFDRCFSECLENKEFVKNYDRLSKRNLGGMLREMESGKTPANWEKEFKKFGNFVRKTVFARMEKHIEEQL